MSMQAITKTQIKEMARSVKRAQGYGYYVDLFVNDAGDWWIGEANTGVSYPDAKARVMQVEPLEQGDKPKTIGYWEERITLFLDGVAASPSVVDEDDDKSWMYAWNDYPNH